ncbi:MAG: hypothetical protein BroJett024_01050 [Alphaproteobacteria bacterium]|nr:MAG: hypothetical protein BroJett024_01050 [Alphaproteobacteria bacterium]
MTGMMNGSGVSQFRVAVPIYVFCGDPSMTNKIAAADAQARLKARREREEDAPRARAEYDAQMQAVLKRTAELRAERLAREAAPKPPAPRRRAAR